MTSLRRRRQIYSFSALVVVVLLNQCHVSQSAGLRGREQWSTTTNSSDFYLQDHNGKEPLVCPLEASKQSGCESNRTVPVCQYNPSTQDYKTRCWKGALPNPHSKSYCGVCKRCFADKDELQAAVNRYKGYTNVDVDLAEKYGWPIGEWCVDKVTSFSHLFFRKSKFNENINSWQTSQVKDMTATFQNAFSFNQPLDQWDTSRVTAMTRMFAMAIHFDQEIGEWDVSQVSDMGYMFLHALEFNSDIRGWQVHNAFSLNSMFFGAHNFQYDDLRSHWQISEHADTENFCSWDSQEQPPAVE